MKRLFLACTACLIAGTHVYADDLPGKTLDGPTKKSIQFFKTQVANNRSIANAMSSLLSRYPEQTASFVDVALTAYPEQYEEIISAAVSTNPMFVDQIIMMANRHEVSNPTEIVEIAVNAEPSYAEVTTREACKISPAYFNEIIRTAVQAEPDSADQIAQKLVKAYPNKTMEILVTTIKEVPFVGKYVLDALLATVQEDNDQSEDMIIISVEQLAQYPDAMERLVELAHERNIDEERLRASAIKGGLDEESITAALNKHYE